MEIIYAVCVTASACLLSILMVPFASTVAKSIGLVDEPNKRKRHVGQVPLAGGMVLLAGLLVALPFLPKTTVTWAVALLSAPLFILGALDDRFDLTARIRILGQLGVGLLLIFVFRLSVDRLDGIFDPAPMILAPLAALLFTLMCACGVLNAINMADGIDGLLGSVSSLTLLAVAVLAIEANAVPEATLGLYVFGLLAGYLIYNLGFFGADRRIFLGDSGSMVVGLILLVLLIELSQRDTPVVTATSAGWLLGLPLLDTVSVMVRRVVQGRSPFAAGRDHFHHVLQDLGLSRRTTLCVLISIQFVLVAVGVLANVTEKPQYYFFWAFVLLTIVQYFGIGGAVKYIAKGIITEQGIDMANLRKA